MWFFAKQLLKKLYIETADGERLRDVKVEKNPIFDERTLEIYDFVVKNGEPVTLRTGNWAQEFYRLDEALRYIQTQFGELEFVGKIVNGS
jgi:hypothetical protein